MSHVHEHLFWFLLVAACVIWYSTVTIVVAVRGMLDIRSMLNRLRRLQSADDAPAKGPGTAPPGDAP